MLIAVASAKGSPGVTTFALGLAARWPARAAGLVEADPAGGDLVTRFGLYHKPGLSTMALAARDTATGWQPGQWVQQLPCQVPAVLAAPGPAAAASLATLGPHAAQMLRLLAEQHQTVIVDAGRWQPPSAADPLLAAADVVLLLVRPEPDDLRQADVRLAALRELAATVRLVLVGDSGPWPPGEITHALGAAVAQVVPVDRRGAGVLTGRLTPRHGWNRDGWSSWTRLPLPRACHTLARQLTTHTTAAGRSEPTAPPAAGPAVRYPVNGQVVNR